MSDLKITAESGNSIIQMSRTFKATPAQLLRAFVDANVLGKWLGPHGSEMRITELNAHHAGAWAYEGGLEGDLYQFRGVFHGDPSVEHGVMQTFEFLGWPGKVAFETMTFEEVEPGTTVLHTHSVYPTVEDRDQMVSSDMEVGVRDGYEKLDGLLADGTL